jgi:hypothetical protein
MPPPDLKIIRAGGANRGQVRSTAIAMTLGS